MHRCGAHARLPTRTVDLSEVVGVHVVHVLQAAIGAANRLTAQSGAGTRQATSQDVLRCCMMHVLLCCTQHHAVVRADWHAAAAAGD